MGLLSERRRISRIQLDQPILAKVSTSRVVLLDISAEGARIEHAFPLSRGKQVTLHFEYGGERVTVACDVIRCKYEKHEEKVSYYSGLRFSDPEGSAMVMLKGIIADAVGRDFEARRLHIKNPD